jgi:hypothetical protein
VTTANVTGKTGRVEKEADSTCSQVMDKQHAIKLQHRKEEIIKT